MRLATKREKIYEYVILVEGKPILRGRNLKELWVEAKRKYPDKELSIRWEPPEGILIAFSWDARCQRKPMST